jgi:hypothetical protein
MEQWKPIPGHPGYQASTEGRIRSGRATLKPWVHYKKKYAQPYLEVELWHGGTFRRVFVHTLVLETFVGPRPPGRQCRHLNGESLDNRWPENLCWGTPRENADDRIRHRPEYYLTPEDREVILAHPELSCRALAAKVGCSKSLVAVVRKQGMTS